MPSPKLTAGQHDLDAVVTEWPDARAKQTFGHRGYVRNGRMFGFCADEGVAVRVWAGEDADAFYASDGVHAFSHSGMEMRAWPILPLRTDEEFAAALTALQNAYERAASA